ncbi:MAG: DUF2147 domain-containing protein [Parafilimonas terrae]|jgi:uncharacterized protein (DUF2147 family)|nr:DUF2147 domain-containing protein [Parafilimonas terrae]
MIRVPLAAMLVMASTAAHAQRAVDFEVDGQKIHIGTARGCDALSCVSVSIPGVFEMGPKRRPGGRAGYEDEPTATAEPPARPAPVEKSATATPPAVQDPVSAPPPAKTVPGPPASLSAVPPVPAARQEADLGREPAAAPAAPPAARAEASPLGVWETEDRKGWVRIEACGRDLCGYALKTRAQANGAKVLIDLKAQGASRWSGQIYDPNTGRTYESTVTLTDGGTLRVQGCAFGGLFCGGQTWNRAG